MTTHLEMDGISKISLKGINKMIHVTLHRHLTYPSPKREATALRPVACVIRARSLVRFTVAKITRRTNINANIDPTLTPALEDIGSASMIEKNIIHSLYLCDVQNALTIMDLFFLPLQVNWWAR